MPTDNGGKDMTFSEPLIEELDGARRARRLLVRLLTICLVELAEDAALERLIAAESQRETPPS